MKSRFDAIKKWLKDCPYLDNYIYFNILPQDVDAISITTEAGITGLLNEYIDGSQQIELMFNINVIKDFDKNDSDINLEAINVFEKISEWIEIQNVEDNLPEFENCIVEKVEAAYTNPDIFINEDETKCEYQARYRLVYLKFKKERKEIKWQ